MLDQNKYLRTGYIICIYQYILHIIDSNLISQYHRIKIHHIEITYMTIIMLGSSYGTKIYEEQDRNRSSYCHKPIVQRWTTPPWSWCWWGRRWRRWRSLRRRLRRSFPLQSSLLQPLFSCFYVSAALSSREPSGVIYIGVFRSKEIGSRKNQASRTIDGEKRHGGAPLMGVPPMLFWASSPSRWGPGAPAASYDEIFMSPKS